MAPTILTDSASAGDPRLPTLVLVCKRPAPGVGKQRLAKTLGINITYEIATQLLACATEDLAAWPGPIVVAPARRRDVSWATTLLPGVRVHAQGRGNLGQRLNRLDGELRARGHQSLVFIGSDAPSLSSTDYEDVRRCLMSYDTVLIPARDGGVVLMASRRPWPDLGGLPWSTGQLGQTLAQACNRCGSLVVLPGGGFDIDEVDDLQRLANTLAGDRRPARQKLYRWLQSSM
jgi:glycosyltransferase A (GT-A) superfamily protein (DUF2064 family)